MWATEIDHNAHFDIASDHLKEGGKEEDSYFKGTLDPNVEYISKRVLTEGVEPKSHCLWRLVGVRQKLRNGRSGTIHRKTPIMGVF